MIFHNLKDERKLTTRRRVPKAGIKGSSCQIENDPKLKLVSLKPILDWQATFIIEGNVSSGWRPVVEESPSCDCEPYCTKPCSGCRAPLSLHVIVFLMRKIGWWLWWLWRWGWDFWWWCSVKTLPAWGSFFIFIYLYYTVFLSKLFQLEQNALDRSARWSFSISPSVHHLQH